MLGGNLDYVRLRVHICAVGANRERDTREARMQVPSLNYVSLETKFDWDLSSTMVLSGHS